MPEISPEPPHKRGRPGRFSLAVLIAFAVLLFGSLAVFARLRADERARALAVWQAKLAVVADARTGAVENWLAERRAGAEVLAWDEDLVGLCVEPACPRGLDLSRAQTHLNNLVRFGGFLGAFLFSPSGQELLAGEGGMPSCPKTSSKVHEVAATGRFALQDIHRAAGMGGLMTGFLVPVFRHAAAQGVVRPRGAPVLGVVGLFVDPARRLFPLVSGGGVAEPGVDVYLVRREGPGARILTPPRGVRDWEALSLQAGPDAVELAALSPAAPVSASRSRVFTDYRGRKVLAAVRWIPTAGWGLVAKVDEEVALNGWRQEVRREVAFGALGLLCLALFGVALWRAWSARGYRVLLEGLRDREERLRALAFGIEDLIFITDRQGRYLLVNPATAALLGVSVDEAAGRPVRDFVSPPMAQALSAHDAEVLKSGSAFQGEEEIPIRGELRTFLSARIPIRDAQGGVQGVAGVLRDITARKHAEEATARRAQSLAALYHLSETFALARAPGHVLDAALDAVVEAFAMDGVGVFLGRPDGPGLLLAAHSSFREAFDAVVDGREPRGVSGRVFHTGGAEFVEDYPSDPDALSEVFHREELASVACLPLQAEGRVLGVLTAGYRARHAFDSEERASLEALGHMVGVALSRSEAQSALACEAFERRRAEERLRRLHESTAQFTGRRVLIEVARALCAELGARRVEVTEVSPDGLGRPLATFDEGGQREQAPYALEGTPCGEVVRRDGLVPVTQEAWRLLPEGSPPGSGRAGFYVGSPLLDSRGAVIGALCAYGDAPRELGAAERDLIDLYTRRVAGEVERIQTEDRLAEARRALETVIQNLPGAVYRSRAGAERIIDYISPGCEPITGYPVGAFGDGDGLSLSTVVVAEDRARVTREVDAALEAGRPYELEYRIHDRQGTIRWIYDVGRPVALPGGSVVLEGVLLDHTERRELEAQLTHSQRMEALGRLAGGVAHDFNNLLTAISGYAEILLGRVPAADRSYRAAQEIARAADRAAELTRQLLSFSRRQTVEPKVLDLNEAVAGTLRMLGRLLGEDVELEVDLAASVGSVRADPSQLEQVALNLCVNARDAMPEGGRLTVRTGVETVRAGMGRTAPELPAGKYAVLEVADTGTGMAPEVVEHIFEPFFTTKDVGKGTGLGLATVYGVVTQAGGRVSVSSSPGSGTKFRVLWPCHSGSGAAADVPAAAPMPEPRGGEGSQVLLAEDEESVRRLAADYLNDLGYLVRAVGSGEAALEEARSGAGVDVLVTDVVMPGMSGPELAQALRQKWPHLPILYISGHTGDTLRERGVGGPGTAFLRKPFRLLDLNRAVETALGR